MTNSELLIKILITILFGAILGLESETRQIEKDGEDKAEELEKERIGGLRTYTILSLFGGLSGIFYLLKESWLVYLSFGALILLVISAYILNVQLKKAFGLTTEIAILITFLLGFLTTSALAPIEVILTILILMTFFLSNKRGIGALIKRVNHDEIIDLFKFLLITIVILPILPNKDFYLHEFLQLFSTNQTSLPNFILINPFQTWLIVVVLSGINLFGYICIRIFGRTRGLILSAFLSGIVSSTSTITHFAHKSKESDEVQTRNIVGASMVANGASFFVVFTLLFLVNNEFALKLLPALILFSLSSLMIGIYLILKTRNNLENETIDIKTEGISLVPALKFVSIVLAIKILIQVLALYKVNSFFVVGITALSGLTGMDAPSVALADLLNNKEIALDVAIAAFFLANLINYFAKIGYSSSLGSRKFAKYLTIALGVTFVVGMVGLVL